MTVERFTVDAALLRELGERLVGRPHIALAELIKNAYDADARRVEIRFGHGQISVSDDGHGMSRSEFVDRWMRIGTTRKQRDRHSPELKRAFTGSKGVGRLASQLLARRLTMTTVALRNPSIGGRDVRNALDRTQLHDEVGASIDWDTAVSSGDLTAVEVDVATSPATARFADGSPCGTTIVLEGLTARWDAAQFSRLAQEIWALQPPFALEQDDEGAFLVTLESAHGRVVEEFGRQMAAILDIWTGRVTATLRDDDPAADVAFVFEPPFEAIVNPDDEDDETADGEGTGGSPTEEGDENPWPSRLLDIVVEIRTPAPTIRNFSVRVMNCRILDGLSYEVRAFDLRHRQPQGVRVSEARNYMRRFGGVHIYDAGFRLPYYGPDVDWLRVGLDHARRLSRSSLLPTALQVRNGMQDLPTNTRLYGGAHISTAGEAAVAADGDAPTGEALAIQVTRDRLVDNEAYQSLRGIVRLGLDAYATEVARAKIRPRGNDPEPPPRPSEPLADAAEVIEQAKDNLPQDQYDALSDHLAAATETSSALEASARAQAALLGALATAGMTTLAYEHESAKQRAAIRAVARRLERLARGLPQPAADQLVTEAKELNDWATKANRLAKLFRPLLDQETRDSVASFNALRFVQRLATDLGVLARGTSISTEGIPSDLALPAAGYAAWSAVFQNLLVNAFNATLETPRRAVQIDGGEQNGRAWLRIQDTGEGVNLDHAPRLFEPFVRDMDADPRRAALGLGGSGLGLAIVRMITDEIGAVVAFEDPEPGQSTAVRIRWRTQ